MFSQRNTGLCELYIQNNIEDEILCMKVYPTQVGFEGEKSAGFEFILTTYF